MGAGLAIDAFSAAAEARVGSVATALLVRMCLIALDDDPAPWARLSMDERCEAIGRTEADGPALDAVRRAVGVLVKAGLIQHRGGGHAGAVSEYTILVKGARSARAIASPKVRDERAEGARSARQKVRDERAPKEHSGERGCARSRARTTNQLPTADEHQRWHRRAVDGSCVECQWTPLDNTRSA